MADPTIGALGRVVLASIDIDYVTLPNLKSATITWPIGVAHVHNAPSSAMQSIVSELLRAHLGFQEERILTHDVGSLTGARPDFYFRLGPERGILAEVEREGAVANSRDLKDLRKAHIAPDAQHLFLIVPYANWKPDGQPRERPFQRVRHR